MKKILSFIFSKEIIFVLFLYAGFYKSVIPLNNYIDLTFLFMVLSVITSLWGISKKGYTHKYVLASISIFGAISFLILFSLIYTTSSEGVNKALHFITVTGWSFIGPFFIVDSKKSINKMLKGIVALALIACFFAVKEYLTNSQGIGQVMVFGSDYLALGRLVGTAILITLCPIMLQKLPKKQLLIGYSLFIFMLIILVISGGRAPLLFILLVFFLFLGFQVKFNYHSGIITYNKSLPWVFFLMVSGIFVFINTNLPAFDTIKIRLSHITNSTGGGKSVIGRTTRFKTATDMIAEKPVLGHGIDSFGKSYGVAGDYPHNIFLEFASELGFIGLFLFVLLLLIAIVKFPFRSLNDTSSKVESWQLLLIFAYSFMNANVSGDIVGNRILFTSISLLIIYVIIYKKQSRVT